MITITTRQARSRYTILPPTLQDAVFSIQNAEIIAATIEKYHLPEEKAEKVPDLVGWVLLGFLHPEDLTEEITSSVGITRELANDMSTSFMNKIFNPIKPILDQSYKPVPEPLLGDHGDSQATQKTKPPQLSAPPAPVPVGPTIISESFVAKPNVPAATIPIPKATSASVPVVTMKPPAITSTPAPPANTSDKGWSRQGSQDPVIKLGVITPNVPAPKPASPASSASAPSAPAAASMVKTPTTPAAAQAAQTQSSTQPPKGMSEFERLDLQKKGVLPQTSTPTPIARTPVVSAPTPTPTATQPTPRSQPASQPAKPPVPPPVMLHQMNAPAGNEKTQNFQVNGAMQNQMNRIGQNPGPAVPMSNRPAVLEFGKNSPGGAGAAAAGGAPATTPRVPTPPPSTAIGGPRQITQITGAPTSQPSIPQPAQPPVPSKPPTPPASADKVIVKDFLR